MFSILCHKDVFMPNEVQSTARNLQQNITGYTYSMHMKQHLQEREDRSHDYFNKIVSDCLETLKYQQREVFEVELSKDYYYFGKSGWFITKYCCRIPYNASQDLVVAIRPYYDKKTKEIDFSKNKIVTAWLNAKNDNHITVDKNNYCSLENWNRINSR